MTMYSLAVTFDLLTANLQMIYKVSCGQTFSKIMHRQPLKTECLGQTYSDKSTATNVI